MPFKQLKPTTIRQEWEALMNNIRICDNMIDSDDEDQVHQAELTSEMEKMSQELGILEEVMSLKSHVDCDCFYV